MKKKKMKSNENKTETRRESVNEVIDEHAISYESGDNPRFWIPDAAFEFLADDIEKLIQSELDQELERGSTFQEFKVECYANDTVTHHYMGNTGYLKVGESFPGGNGRTYKIVECDDEGSNIQNVIIDKMESALKNSLFNVYSQERTKEDE